MRLLVSLLLFSVTVLGYNPEEDLLYDHFPEDFVWAPPPPPTRSRVAGTRTARV